MALDPIEKYLGENIGGVVSIGAINNLFDRKKEKYEDAFEHFLNERYGPDASKDEEYGDEPDWVEDEDSTNYPSHPTDGSPEDTSMPSWMMEEDLAEDMYSSNEPHFSPRELKAAFLYAFESAQKNPDMNVEMAFRAWQDIPKLADDEGRPLGEGEISDIISNWVAVDKAQLNYYKENGPKNIQVGDNNFEIRGYFMNSNDVPTIEIMNPQSKKLHHLPLSVVWNEYQNYSALDNAGRKELMNSYNLD